MSVSSRSKRIATGAAGMHLRIAWRTVGRKRACDRRVIQFFRGVFHPLRLPWVIQAPVFIVIAIDFHKTDLGARKAGQTQIVHESMEGFGAAATDAGIVRGTLITAAESLGLGIVPIGGIRRSPQGMVDLLGLPPLTFPLVGLCIGHIKDNAPLKPRMDIRTFRHDERYDASGYAAAIDAYDTAIMNYWKQIGRSGRSEEH